MSTSIVPWPALAGAVVAAVIGALYAGADIAITSLSPTRLEALLDQAAGADKAAYERIQRENSRLRSRYLLGRVAAAAVTAVCMLEVFDAILPGGAAAAVALAITVLLTAVLFEVTTTLARRYVDRSALVSARWLRPLELAMVPLADPLGSLGARLIPRRAEQPADTKIAEAEVEDDGRPGRAQGHLRPGRGRADPQRARFRRPDREGRDDREEPRGGHRDRDPRERTCSASSPTAATRATPSTAARPR